MGIEGINSRIADIQSRIIGLQTQAAGKVAPSRQVTTTSGATGDSFASYLQNGLTPDFDSVGGSMVEVQKNMAKLPNEDAAAKMISDPHGPSIDEPSKPAGLAEQARAP